jgi:hypothetical protein
VRPPITVPKLSLNLRHADANDCLYLFLAKLYNLVDKDDLNRVWTVKVKITSALNSLNGRYLRQLGIDMSLLSILVLPGGMADVVDRVHAVLHYKYLKNAEAFEKLKHKLTWICRGVLIYFWIIAFAVIYR